MIYAYDDWVQAPVQSLYDTQMMAMAVNAAKDMYEKGQEQVKDFYTKYGDFMSPFSKDMERYGEMVGGVRDAINQMYANGIDPLRSAEGRAIIAQLTNSVNPAEFNLMRSNAKMGYAYQDALRQLAAKGKSSQALEDYIASLPGNVAFNDFSTAEHGTWNRMPTEYSTLQEFVHPSFANLKPHLLTADEARTRVGSAYDPTYEYTGITKGDMERSMIAALPGLVGSPLYGFYRQQAENELKAMGYDNPTADQINARFVQNAITADSQMMTPLSREMSKSAEYALKDKYDAKSKARDYYYDNLLKHDLDGDGKIDADEKEYARQEKEATIEAKRNKGGRGGNGSSQGLNYYQDQFDRGLNFFTYKNAGDPPQTYEQLDKNSRNVIHASMAETRKLAQIKNYNDPNWSTERDAFLNGHTAKNLLSQEVLTKSIGRAVDGSRSHCVFTTDGDIDKLYDADEIVSSTLGAKGAKVRRLTDRSNLDKFRAGGQAADKLKMQFTNETYTAPITNNKGEVRMIQYQKVNLYGQTSKKSDEFIGTKWYKVQQSAPTKGVIKNGKRYYNSVATTWDGEDSGDMQYMSTEAEHVLRSTSEGKHNDQTRF